MDNLLSLSVCSALRHKSTPTTCLPNKTPTPTTTMVKLSLFRLMTKQFTSWHHYLLQHHPLALVWCHSLYLVPLLRVPRAVLPVPALSLAPMPPARPPPPSGCLWVGRLTLAPCWIPDHARARSATLPHPSSAVALVVTVAGAA